jgi:hypothetical protein
MTPDEQIDELILRWEEARGQGVNLSPSALCAGCPQFVEEVRARIRAIEDMENILGVRDPDPRRTLHEEELNGTTLPAEPLPRIPGYEIVRVVGEGGMGVVYEAVQLDLGRTVAVKMISGPRLGPKLIARFRAEAEAAARLQHPNVLQIFEVGQVNERPFFSMEFVNGDTLAQRIARDRPAPRQAAELVETLARAVHSAHTVGIIHRDLKPANVMLTPTGTPKIADFGLAKRLDEDSGHTQTGEILGTPAYMAPEQAEGKREIGPAADIYALGAILYELLTGKPPFQGTTPLDTLRLVTTREPVPPRKLNQLVPPDLEAICLKCLEKSPSLRYASAHDLAEDLRKFLDGRPVVARRTGVLGRAWKWMWRHPVETAFVGLLLGLACLPVYSLIAAYQTQREQRLRAEQQAPLVREILQQNCATCHDGTVVGDPPKKTFDALNHESLLDVARNIVIPGVPEKSRLLKRIADGSMPPEEDEKTLPRLTESELTSLREWILGGAPAFPPEDVAVPTVVAPDSPVAAEVKKIFIERCYKCHKWDVAKGGIKILHHRLLVSVREVVVPGRPEESELFQLITQRKNQRTMPPDKPLSAEEIATIRQWIVEGAPPFPRGE